VPANSFRFTSVELEAVDDGERDGLGEDKKASGSESMWQLHVRRLNEGRFAEFLQSSTSTHTPTV
jgi:hypothetical protein